MATEDEIKVSSADPKKIVDDDDEDEEGHFASPEDELEEALEVTWGEVFNTCCVHTPAEWVEIFIGFVLVLFILYWFMFSLDLLGTSAKVMTGCKAGELLGDDTNPITGVMIGLLATALIHSSSTVTSIIVAITPSVITVQQGIYIMMGSNIGTTVTNTMVSLAQMADPDQLERAFAGATVHDAFNVYSLLLFFPIEWATGMLKHIVEWMTKNADPGEGERWDGPVKKYVGPLSAKVIVSNSGMMEDIALNSTLYNCDTGGEYYPTECEDPSNPTKKTCKVGLISCSKKTGECPAFFQVGAVAKDDKVSGGAVFFVSVVLLFICLAMLILVLQRMLLGVSTRIIYKATDVNGYVAICIGCGVTMLIQSSSVVTSVLTPLVGLDILPLEKMYALTIGANMGTCITALLAAMVSDSVESLQVALSHLVYNFLGAVAFWPIPITRQLILVTSKRIGKCTRIWRGFPFVFIAVMFGILPITLMGVAAFFDSDQKGYVVIGSFIVGMIIISLLYTWYHCRYNGGREECMANMAERERKRVAMEELPNDMDYIKAKLAALVEYTGLPADEDEIGLDNKKMGMDDEADA